MMYPTSTSGTTKGRPDIIKVVSPPLPWCVLQTGCPLFEPCGKTTGVPENYGDYRGVPAPHVCHEANQKRLMNGAKQGSACSREFRARASRGASWLLGQEIRNRPLTTHQ